MEFNCWKETLKSVSIGQSGSPVRHIGGSTILGNLKTGLARPFTEGRIRTHLLMVETQSQVTGEVIALASLESRHRNTG